jgi:hypothetical protein
MSESTCSSTNCFTELDRGTALQPSVSHVWVAVSSAYLIVALLIIWHTSEPIIWRGGSESGRKCLWHADSCRNSRPQTLLGISEGTLGTIVCQIIRTRMCQIISKTTARFGASAAGKHGRTAHGPHPRPGCGSWSWTRSRRLILSATMSKPSTTSSPSVPAGLSPGPY